MNKKRQIAFILNPHSGTHSKQMIPELIDKHLDKSKFDYQLLYTEHSGHAAEIALNCVEQQIDIVVAVGGDGTVNEVAHLHSLRHHTMRVGQRSGTPPVHTTRPQRGHSNNKQMQD